MSPWSNLFRGTGATSSFERQVARDSSNQHNGHVYNVYGSRPPFETKLKDSITEDWLIVDCPESHAGKDTSSSRPASEARNEDTLTARFAQADKNQALLSEIRKRDTDWHRVRALLEDGASANCVDEDGRAPLDYAALDDQEHGQGVRLLLVAGADVNKVDDKFDTALLRAAAWSPASDPWFSVAALLQAGADVNHSNKMGETALMRGVRDHIITYKLINAGADVNRKDNEGKTALHYSCLRYCLCQQLAKDVAQLLLEAGADVNARNNQRQTVLAVLLRDCNRTATYIPTHLIAFLKENGATQ